MLWLQCTPVMRSIWIIRWSSNCWAGLSSNFISSWCFMSSALVSRHHTQQVSPNCCSDVLHKWALHHFPVHTSHKACMSSQPKQWLVSSDLHHVSQSSDTVWRAFSLVLALVLCTSEHCTGNWVHTPRLQCTSVTTSVSSITAVIDGLGCAAYSSSTDNISEDVVLVRKHHTQQMLPTCACNDVLHELALYYFGSQGLCVESNEAVRSASYFNNKWCCFMRTLTCAYIGFLHIWALYWNWAHVLLWFQSTSVTRLVCQVRWSSGGELGFAWYFTIISWWWSVSIPNCACIAVLHIWALYWKWAHMLLWFQCTLVTRHVVSVCSHRVCEWDPITSNTQICFHWCFCTSHMLWLQCASVTRSICIIRWSSDWWAWLQLVRAAGSPKLNSTAACQFGCNDCNQVRPVSPVVHMQLRCNFQPCLPSCSLSAHAHTVTFTATSQLCPAIYGFSFVLSTHPQPVCSLVSYYHDTLSLVQQSAYRACFLSWSVYVPCIQSRTSLPRLSYRALTFMAVCSESVNQLKYNRLDKILKTICCKCCGAYWKAIMGLFAVLHVHTLFLVSPFWLANHHAPATHFHSTPFAKHSVIYHHVEVCHVSNLSV